MENNVFPSVWQAIQYGRTALCPQRRAPAVLTCLCAKKLLRCERKPCNRDHQGHEPVDDFIERLAPAHQSSVDGQIDLLNDLDPHGPPLAYPHSSQVRGTLRELRCHHGRTLYRILYRRSGNLFVLLHIFNKRDAQVPQENIDIAQARWEDFEKRMNAHPRKPPRAAGHDAPPIKRQSEDEQKSSDGA